MADHAQTPYYRHHVLFCVNDRGDSRESCAALGAQDGYEHCKAAVKAAGIWGQGGVRVNQTSCLGRCSSGPVAVVYPEGSWYTFLDQSDIEEIVASHLKGDQVVDRLRLEPDFEP